MTPPTALPPLIDAADLQALLQVPSQPLLVLDCRFQLSDTEAGRRAYTDGHIPGALYAHLDEDLSGPKTQDGRLGRHPLPSPEAWQATLRRWGVRANTRVVAYDDMGGAMAARLWWLLHWAGHPAVQVLDGGWPAWRAQGGTVNTSPAPTPTPGDVIVHVRPEMVLSTADVRALPADRWLLDARSPDRFRGENETLDPIGGHIPGASNRFFQLNLRDGRFKPAEELRAEFDALLAGRPAHSVVHQCGSGVTACHNLLAMAHAGWPLGRLYAGSWSAWCAQPDAPVER
jgi:thiosulfate/3-mercaptopyruvate sulfurtransferase